MYEYKYICMYAYMYICTYICIHECMPDLKKNEESYRNIKQIYVYYIMIRY